MPVNKTTDDRLIGEFIDPKTGDVVSSRSFSIKKEIKLKMPSGFFLSNSNNLYLDYRTIGAFTCICQNFLHYDTMRLYVSKDIPKLKTSDMTRLLKISESTLKRKISRLKEAKAIISPSKSRELYANPRFALKGGLFDREEIEMLIYHDKHIKKLINKLYLKDYNLWKIRKK